MKKLNWFLGVGLTIVGLLIIIFPAACVKTVAVLLGLCSIAYGIFCFVDSKKLVTDNSFITTTSFVKNISSIVFGVLTVILPLAIASTAWKIMVYIFAIYLILEAIFGFYSVSVLKDSIDDRKRFIFENLTLLIAGILLILISPEKLGIVIIRIIGIVAFVVGIVFLVIAITALINKKKTEIVVDAEVKDEPVDSNN